MSANLVRHLDVPGDSGHHDHHMTCELESKGSDRIGLRIASIFIIFAASLLGALLPVLLRRSASSYVPGQLFFAFKFIGTGVIVGTAWMHLLSPAVEILGHPCLEPRFSGFDWASAIAGMTFMVMFFVHLLVAKLGPDTAEEAAIDETPEKQQTASTPLHAKAPVEVATCFPPAVATKSVNAQEGSSDQSSRQADDGHCDVEKAHRHEPEERPDSLAFAAQLAAISILEFGVIFHSVFIGLVLATTDELVILLIVLVFHQLFEGLGLGARLAIVPWTKSRQWLPYAFCLAFAVSTPLGTAAGLGARPDDSEAQMLTNGIFDAISAGILLYTGVFELMGREFFFNSHMRHASLTKQLSAYGYIAAGFTTMTVLAKWA